MKQQQKNVIMPNQKLKHISYLTSKQVNKSQYPLQPTHSLNIQQTSIFYLTSNIVENYDNFHHPSICLD